MDKHCSIVWKIYQEIRKRARLYDASSLDEVLMKSGIFDGDSDWFDTSSASIQKRVRKLCECLGI